MLFINILTLSLTITCIFFAGIFIEWITATLRRYKVPNDVIVAVKGLWLFACLFLGVSVAVTLGWSL